MVPAIGLSGVNPQAVRHLCQSPPCFTVTRTQESDSMPETLAAERMSDNAEYIRRIIGNKWIDVTWAKVFVTSGAFYEGWGGMMSLVSWKM